LRDAKTEQAKTYLRQLPPTPRTRTPPPSSGSCGSTSSTRAYRFFLPKNPGKLRPAAATSAPITSALLSPSAPRPRSPAGTRLRNGRRCSGSEEASRQAWKKSWRKQGGICLRRGHFICFDAYQLRATVHLLSQRSGKFAVVFEISNLNSNGSSSYCLGVIRLYKVVESLY
jgi:hypothetical protein